MKRGTEGERRIGIAGCKNTTADLALALSRRGVALNHIVSISPDLGVRQKVAGYVDLAPVAEEVGAQFTQAATYGLTTDADREVLLALRLDLLLVIGWRRLIPDWLIESLSIGAFGMHGSFKPLPHGRGRSPMNWSLLQGRDLFFTHLFKYSPGVDDGPIVGMQVFDLTPFDTAQTVHLKNEVAMIKLCERWLTRLLDGTARMTAQPLAADAPHWPTRTEEDGLIYWSDTSTDLYNLVRAVTKPFKGAFTFLGDGKNKLTIWRAIPFDTHLRYDGASSGEILEVFHDQTLLVKTADTSLLILDYEGRRVTRHEVGSVLTDLGTPRKEWPLLPS